MKEKSDTLSFLGGKQMVQLLSLAVFAITAFSAPLSNDQSYHRDTLRLMLKDGAPHSLKLNDKGSTPKILLLQGFLKSYVADGLKNELRSRLKGEKDPAWLKEKGIVVPVHALTFSMDAKENISLQFETPLAPLQIKEVHHIDAFFTGRTLTLNLIPLNRSGESGSVSLESTFTFRYEPKEQVFVVEKLTANITVTAKGIPTKDTGEVKSVKTEKISAH